MIEPVFQEPVRFKKIKDLFPAFQVLYDFFPATTQAAEEISSLGLTLDRYSYKSGADVMSGISYRTGTMDWAGSFLVVEAGYRFRCYLSLYI
ncbi:MAG: hypothetical protein J0L53_13910 [Spirochaetes bacterium]|nr:hypothetical protein [Spirochaetota bacterium]